VQETFRRFENTTELSWAFRFILSIDTLGNSGLEPRTCLLACLVEMTRKIPVVVLAKSLSGPGTRTAIGWEPMHFANFSQITPKLRLLWGL
jgi:hypothetical protein